MISLRQALAGIGEPKQLPFAVRGSFGRRTPHSLVAAIIGMSDPNVGSWQEAGISLKSENTDISHNAQGATSDGRYWYVCSNGSKSVMKYDDAAKRILYITPTQSVQDQIWSVDGNRHFGAPAFRAGRISVPIQGPHGVWSFDQNGKNQQWQPVDAPSLPEDDMFPWCDVHPVTGLLYTSNYRVPKYLRAYSLPDLVWRQEHDIQLGPRPIPLDQVQGGVFTERGRVILNQCDPNAIFCFSALNGHCFGAKYLSLDKEGEGVTVRPWMLGGTKTLVHVLELDDDYVSGDDCYLHSLALPYPDRL